MAAPTAAQPTGVMLHRIGTWSRYSRYDEAYRVEDADGTELGIVKMRHEWKRTGDDAIAKDLTQRWYIPGDRTAYQTAEAAFEALRQQRRG